MLFHRPGIGDTGREDIGDIEHYVGEGDTGHAEGDTGHVEGDTGHVGGGAAGHHVERDTGMWEEIPDIIMRERERWKEIPDIIITWKRGNAGGR